MSASVQPIVHTPGPWHQYAKTVRAGNLNGYDVTANGNYTVVARDCTEEDSRLIAMLPEMLKLLEDSCFSIGGDWRNRRDDVLANVGRKVV